ncbi:MAG TPA: signal peptide peptidase SppA [Geobacteraceae bacterium]|nr:signal peptide peptidase SppA [Geobacteraceae bacterium]
MKNKWIWMLLGFGFFLMLSALTALFAINLIFGESSELNVSSGVGVVEVKGIILDPQETVKQLNDFAKDDKVKAVVLRIDSPGGVVGPSQEIWSAVKKLKQKKKVIASMGSVAASGGYYIAAPASLIYANPGTITGSIGVLMKFSNLEGLMEKVGMKSFTLKTGKYKDVGSPSRKMTEDEKAMLLSVIESTHTQFVKAVAEGRNLPEATVRELADGRIFSGEQAMGHKLVDRLGTMQDAIEEAGRLGGISGEPHVIKPPKKKHYLLDMLVEESAGRFGNLIRKDKGFSLSYELEGIEEQ